MKLSFGQNSHTQEIKFLLELLATSTSYKFQELPLKLSISTDA
jgi:hypothetical protein